MKRTAVLVLVLVLLLGAMPVYAAGDAMEPESLKELVNSQTLYPQSSGYPQVDALLEEILGPYAESDNYTKLKEAYNWVVMEVNYSWAPYSQTWAPAYDCFVPVYDLEYEEGLEEVIPFEVVNRSYHVLTKREGICYDYGAVFALMARYLGFESYVHTGDFIFEAGFGTGSGHHGWAELLMDGKSYIFDPQRDYRMCYNATQPNPYMYFGIGPDRAWRYTQETGANAQRDAQFLSVTAVRHASVEAVATASGSTEGSGSYGLGETVRVTASGEKPFLGWYDTKGRCVSEEMEYSFVLRKPTVLRAVFAGEYFEDIEGQWYTEDVNAAFEQGLVNGLAPFRFEGQQTMSRAMALTVLYRYAQPETVAEAAGYSDVPAGIWYEAAVNWGTQEGIVRGIGDGLFAPDASVTREQFITMMMRLAALEEEAELEYEDAASVSGYARAHMRKAQAAGLLTGYKDGCLRPQNQMTRAEGATLLMRLIRLLTTE